MDKTKNEANEKEVSVWFQILRQVCIFSSDDIIFKKLQINKYFSKLIKLAVANKNHNRTFISFSHFYCNFLFCFILVFVIILGDFLVVWRAFLDYWHFVFLGIFVLWILLLSKLIFIWLLFDQQVQFLWPPSINKSQVNNNIK